jgi:hypothetical protein
LNTAQTNIFPWSGAPDSPFNKGLTRPLLLISQVVYVIFLSAGHFKENLNWIPFDLTIGAGVLVLVLSVLIFLAEGGKIPYAALWMALFFGVMGVSALWTQWTPYAIEKTTRFYTLSLLGWLIPAMILKDLRGIKRFMWMLIVLGLVLSSGVILQVANGGFNGDIGERTTGFATITIALGSDAGQALVALYALALRGGKWVWLSAICVPLFITIVASGARGPLFVAVFVLVLLTLRFSKFRNVNVWIAIALIVTALTGLSGFTSMLPQGSVRRIEKVLQGAEDKSGEARKDANLVALEEAANNPFGLGFGGFGRVYNFGSKTDRIYPHNVFLEIAAENGSLVALLFIGIVLISMRRSYRAAVDRPELRPFLALLLFTVGESLISGEININRLLYGLVLIGLMLPAILARAHEAEAELAAGFS